MNTQQILKELLPDEYTITDKKLGAGTYGKVYLGSFKKEDVPCQVAIKKIQTNDPATRRELAVYSVLTEVRNSNKQHEWADYLLRAFGYRIGGKNTTLVLEFANVGNLSDYVQSTFPDNQTIYTITLCLINGLGYLHNNGIIHGDFKPKNIMVCEKDGDINVKIGDFGSARWKGETFDPYCSPAFAAPELHANISQDTSSDIYSYGCVLFETWTGIDYCKGLDGKQLTNHILYQKKRDEFPKHVPRKVILGTQLTWLSNPADRPTADRLSHYFQSSLDDIPEDTEARLAQLRPSPNTY